ncbi:MAG: hypothetical protein U9N83_17875 [Thermodesulfobacteriota bacterium]|nr:hypothetical protein [Thermodesulfobacteriota bacterium]
MYLKKIFTFFSKSSGLKDLPLATYSVAFSLDKLVPGVDNIHYDVHLSPALCKSANKVIRQLLGKHARVEKILGTDRASSPAKERDDFRRLCSDVLQEAINKAKLDSEPQIDLMAQIAIVKMLTGEIQRQFKALIDYLNNYARKLNTVAQKYEISKNLSLSKYIQIKDKLSDIQEQKQSILLNVGQELCGNLIDVQRKDLKEMREAIFGIEINLPDDVFSNPILHTENPSDDFFMIDEYILIGHRFEDPDNYNKLLFLIRGFLRNILLKIFLKNLSASEGSKQGTKIFNQKIAKTAKNDPNTRYQEIDVWLKQIDNIDILFNSFQSKERYKILKRQNGDKKALIKLKKQIQQQEKLLNFIYRKFKKAGLIKRITAAYEMQSVYLDYCPPLVPHQVLQFLTKPGQRRRIVSQFNRLKGFYGKSFSLVPLKKKLMHLKKITRKDKKKYLIRFLNGFARYHRDLQNFTMLKQTMDSMNLVSEKRIIDLSHENRLLYEFLAPNEQILEAKPIVNHVIIKADIRDSTNITYQMKKRGLNPASFFSLNFFAPITGILFKYDAEKLFIEGDAIILSIIEHQDTPEGWYCVARACGLAMKMLLIVQRYNENSMQHNLPVLELGIGICYNDSSPTFLFDEDHRIIISPAINAADRMSKCAKPFHKPTHNNKKPFNLYVYKSASEKDSIASTDDMLFRYNINGIELNPEGFEKLSKEINLKSIECHIPDLQKEKIKINTGKFPTVTGEYQRLVIREAPIPEVVPDELRVIRQTDQKYYEVCTHPMLHEYVENL